MGRFRKRARSGQRPRNVWALASLSALLLSSIASHRSAAQTPVGTSNPTRTVVVLSSNDALVSALRLELDARRIRLSRAEPPSASAPMMRAAEVQRGLSGSGAVAGIWLETDTDLYEVRLVAKDSEAPHSTVIAADHRQDPRILAVAAASLVDEVITPPAELSSDRFASSQVAHVGPGARLGLGALLDAPTTDVWSTEWQTGAAPERSDAAEMVEPEVPWRASRIRRRAYLRFGIVVAMVPRPAVGFAWMQDYFGGAVRLAAGKFIVDRFRLEAYATLFAVSRHGFASSLGAQAMYASRGRIRFGFGLAAAVHAGQHNDGGQKAFARLELAAPLEAAYEVSDRVALSVSGGLTVMTTGNSSNTDGPFWPGAQLTLEVEWHLR